MKSRKFKLNFSGILRLNTALFKLVEPLNKVVETLCLSIDRFYVLSGYKINRDLYIRLIPYMVYNIAFLSVVVVILSILFILLKVPILRYIVISTSIVLMGLFLSVAFFFSYPLVLIHRRATHFNERILYTLSYIVPLVATNATLTDIISKVYLVEKDPEIKHELGLILKECALGLDIVTAIQRSIDRVPSIVYKDVMSALIESVRLSQDPCHVLLQKLEALIRNKFLRLRQITVSLTLLFQTYVVLAFLAPALVIVIYAAFSITLLTPVTTSAGAGALGQPLASISPPLGDVFAIALLMTIFYSPLVAVIFYILFDSIMSVL